jgi:hypothetical protein
MKESSRMTELVEKLRQAKILRKAMNATVIIKAKEDKKSESPQKSTNTLDSNRKRSISSGLVNGDVKNQPK